MPSAVRSAWDVTSSVWLALFLREAVSRLFSSRAAWFWIFAEPLFHVSYLVVIYTALRVRAVGGIDMATWLSAGLIVFFLFRRVAIQGMNAIDANRTLLAYRQVKPIDTVLVRAALEAAILCVMTLLFVVAMMLFGVGQRPDDPLRIILGALALWFFALGVALSASVANERLGGAGKLISMLMMPLYFTSGVMFPVTLVPEPYRSALLLNPITHGIELVRQGFSLNYHTDPRISLGYLSGCALAALVLGVALHRRCEDQLRSEA